MSQLKNLPAVLIGLSLIIVLGALITPTKTKGQGGNQCFNSHSFDGGPFTPVVTFSGQLVDVP